MDCSPPGSSVHGIAQPRTLERAVFPPPGELPDPGIEPGTPALTGGFFTDWAPRRASSLCYPPRTLLTLENPYPYDSSDNSSSRKLHLSVNVWLLVQGEVSRCVWLCWPYSRCSNYWILPLLYSSCQVKKQVSFSCLVISDSLQPPGLQLARLL